MKRIMPDPGLFDYGGEIQTEALPAPDVFVNIGETMQIDNQTDVFFSSAFAPAVQSAAKTMRQVLEGGSPR